MIWLHLDRNVQVQFLYAAQFPKQKISDYLGT